MQSLMDQVTEWMEDMSQKEMEETGGEIKRFWYRFPGALGSAVGEYTGTEDSLRKHLDQEILTAWCGTKARPSSVAVYVVPYVGEGHKMDLDNEFTHISFTGRDILSKGQVMKCSHNFALLPPTRDKRGGYQVVLKCEGCGSMRLEYRDKIGHCVRAVIMEGGRLSYERGMTPCSADEYFHGPQK